MKRNVPIRTLEQIVGHWLLANLEGVALDKALFWLEPVFIVLTCA